MKSKTIQELTLVSKDGSVHGRIVYSWGESPYCSTYCAMHVKWILEQGWDIIPEHNQDTCAGFVCSHKNPFDISVS